MFGHLTTTRRKRLCAAAEQGATDGEAKDRPLGEADREVIASILKRFNPEAKAEAE